MPEESAFAQAVTELDCDNMQTTKAELQVDIEKRQKGDKSDEEWWVIANDWKEKCAAMEQDLRKQLRAQVKLELLAATATDLAAVEELRECMTAEVTEEAAQKAAKAKAQAQEGERQEKREKEEKARKRRLGASEREQHRNKKLENGSEDTGSGGEGVDDDDSGDESDSSSGYSLKGDIRDYEKHPVTREEVAAEEKAQAESELIRQESESNE